MRARWTGWRVALEGSLFYLWLKNILCRCFRIVSRCKFLQFLNFQELWYLLSLSVQLSDVFHTLLLISAAKNASAVCFEMHHFSLHRDLLRHIECIKTGPQTAEQMPKNRLIFVLFSAVLSLCNVIQYLKCALLIWSSDLFRSVAFKWISNMLQCLNKNLSLSHPLFPNLICQNTEVCDRLVVFDYCDLNIYAIRWLHIFLSIPLNASLLLTKTCNAGSAAFQNRRTAYTFNWFVIWAVNIEDSAKKIIFLYAFLASIT